MTTTHHAWFCESREIPSELKIVLANANSEVLTIEESVLRIDTVRQLIATAHTTSLSHENRTCVIVAHELTHESQNALLKLFEDPPAHTTFYLVMPTISSLIPTLRSRLQVFEHQKEIVDVTAWESFKILSIAEQLSLVAEKTKAKDTAWQQSIVSGAAQDKGVSKQSLLLLDTYLRTRGASRKMLLEQLVLSLHDSQKSMSAVQ